MGWMIIATLCAFLIKGMCGFANTLVFTSILSFGMNNVNISPVELVLGYPSNVLIAWRERRSVRRNIWLPLALLVIAGSIPGMFLLKTGDVGLIKVIFGVVVIAVGLEMLFREYHARKGKSSKVLLGVIGVLSGLLCGLYGIGALLAAYIGRTTEDSSAFKGNICMVFIVENTFRIVLYTVMGIITSETVLKALKLMPVMVLGLVLGLLAARRVPEKIVKKMVIVMLIISGIALIINNL